jgi:segregation and condensation protein B
MIDERNDDPVSEESTDLAESYGDILHQEWQAEVGAEPSPRDASADEVSSTENAEPTEATAEEPPPVLRIIEALLFVGGDPLARARAAEIIRGLTDEQFAEAIDTLNHAYRRQNRPYTIQAQGQGHVLTLRPRFKGILEKIYGGVREARLSTVAIDVLSLVAYRQPVTKAEIDSFRGAESGALLRQLVRRGLISVVHRGEADRKEVSYGTTQRFLEFFGLKDLDDLPRTQDLQQM